MKCDGIFLTNSDVHLYTPPPSDRAVCVCGCCEYSLCLWIWLFVWRSVSVFVWVYMLCVCVCVYMLCICVFVRPGCVWRCQAIWSAVWGAHYPLSSAVGSGVLSICHSSLAFFLSSLPLSHPLSLSPLSFVLIFIYFYFLERGFIFSLLSLRLSCTLTLLFCFILS